uniref:Mannitol-1-phosphate 5-dehydrogenase n=1 Tax=Lygus hesperus TaxID=30085 RepID=A0A0A9YMB7_LYGHE
MATRASKFPSWNIDGAGTDDGVDSDRDGAQPHVKVLKRTPVDVADAKAFEYDAVYDEIKQERQRQREELQLQLQRRKETTLQVRGGASVLCVRQTTVQYGTQVILATTELRQKERE